MEEEEHSKTAELGRKVLTEYSDMTPKGGCRVAVKGEHGMPGQEGWVKLSSRKLLLRDPGQDSEVISFFL